MLEMHFLGYFPAHRNFKPITVAESAQKQETSSFLSECQTRTCTLTHSEWHSRTDTSKPTKGDIIWRRWIMQMAFCLHYENVEDVFLHDWGAYQVGLSAPPTQYISSSEMRVGGWRAWIFLRVPVWIFVWELWVLLRAQLHRNLWGLTVCVDGNSFTDNSTNMQALQIELHTATQYSNWA